MNEPYKILIAGAEAETELKKSRFIAHVEVADSEEKAQEFVASMKKKYYDARHNCYAYIIGKDADCVKYSDDGEPSQTAGLPIFNVIKESGVRNVVIVVTRYFGGTLLGAGPLARMYVEAAKLGLEASVTAWMRYGTKVSVTTDYPDGEKVRRYLERESIDISDVCYSDQVETLFTTAFDRFAKIEKEIVSITGGRAVISRKTDAYFVDKG